MRLPRIRILRAYLAFLGVFALFWWPLSHWFYPGWYHDLLGFSGPPDEALVKVIGTIGIVPVLGLFFVAWNPLRNRDFLIALLAFYPLMAATYVYLIADFGFPSGEYVNVALLAGNSLLLAALYPWRSAGEYLDAAAPEPSAEKTSFT